MNSQVESDSAVAVTILQQLGGRTFQLLTGAKHLIDHGDALSFKIGAGAKNKINHVKVFLNGLDLYDVTFSRINFNTYDSDLVESYENIDAEQLQATFECATGFYTRF